MAVKVLYSLADHEGGSLEKVLEDFWRNFRFRDDVLGEAVDLDEAPLRPEVRSFAESLICGVAEHLEEIDAAIGTYSTNWALDRMPRVDLALMRLGAYELLFCPEVPHNVVINEAIEIGKRFGSEESSAFINGVLDQVSKRSRSAAS